MIRSLMAMYQLKESGNEPMKLLTDTTSLSLYQLKESGNSICPWLSTLCSLAAYQLKESGNSTASFDIEVSILTRYQLKESGNYRLRSTVCGSMPAFFVSIKREWKLNHHLVRRQVDKFYVSIKREWKFYDIPPTPGPYRHPLRIN